MARKKKDDLKPRRPEQIIERNMEDVMHDSMMPYSEYVILERALPRVALTWRDNDCVAVAETMRDASGVHRIGEQFPHGRAARSRAKQQHAPLANAALQKHRLAKQRRMRRNGDCRQRAVRIVQFVPDADFKRRAVRPRAFQRGFRIGHSIVPMDVQHGFERS